MDHDAITCSDFLRTMADYLAGELCSDDDERSRLHVQVCPECADYLKNYEFTAQLGRDSRADDLDPAPLPEDLVQSILAARRRMR